MKDATFSAARLLELYDRISDAEDAIPHLRRFVLDLAVRGKLVEQDTAEESALELMQRAKTLKDEEGVKTKADPIQGDDIPFPAPLGWIWTRLGAIALQTGSGSTPRGGKSAYSDDGTPFLRSQNIYDDGLRMDDVVFINDETNEKMKRTKVKPKDLLLNITGGSIGRCARIPDEFSGANVSQHVAIIRTAAPGTEDYLHLLVRSPFFQDYVLGEQTGAGRGGLPKNRMDRIPFPLPPLAEQHQIVAKVEELMALCDRLEEARTAREAVRDRLITASLARLTAPETDAETFQSHARFSLQSLPTFTTRPDQIKTLRQIILNLAVQGKLVEQDATDEPASELLTRIRQEKATLGKRLRPDVDNVTDLPFALPRAWALTSIGEVCSKTGSGSTPRGGKEVYTDNGVPFFRSQNIYDDGLRLDDVALISSEIHERMSGTAVKPADLLLNITGGSMGRCCRIPDDFGEANVSQHVAIIRPAITDMSDFLHRLVLSPYFQAFIFGEQTGAGRGGLPKNRMDRIAVALPPLAEQYRIVAKVDALMTLCDQLEASLTTTATTRSKLLKVVLHEALEPSAETANV